MCSIENCDGEVKARGWCFKHYMRWRRTGDVLKVRQRTGNTSNHTAIHGHCLRAARTPTYCSWDNMIQRCTNPKRREFQWYGGRGITVCERWLKSYSDFLSDMDERPEGKTLDRIDVNGNYEPANCRWTTKSVQEHNKQRNC